MAMPVQPLLIGVDVSKADLAICTAPGDPVQTIDNAPKAISAWLKSLPAGPVRLAIEATNTFHLALAERTHKAGHTVYLIDGYRLNRYRDSIGGRAKTDTSDARLLRRYLSRELDDLRAWTPPPRGYSAVQRLLHRRAKLIQARVTLQQSLTGLPELKRSTSALLRRITQLDHLIQKRLFNTLAQLNWHHDVKRCQAIEGIGPITGAALTMMFHRGAFHSADAFVAFLGLDVRVRESGKMRGRRKLTKNGDPELRRLLYLAAMYACRTPAWQAFYQRHLDRGLAKIQALVVLARKLARVAFALLKNQSEYRSRGAPVACAAT